MKFKIPRDQENLSEGVRKYLEEAILSGKYRAHEKLPTETELCKSFGVSRTVIREALNKLKSQGFLQSITGRGTFVLPYDFSHVNTAIERFGMLNTDKDVAVSLLQLRTLIELECTERLARNPVEPVCAKLEKTVEQMADLMKAGPRKRWEFNDLDEAFHRILIESSGNPVFVMLFDVLRRTITYPFDQEHFPVSSEEIMEKTHAYHSGILQRIKARDPEGARQAIRSHLDYATELYVHPEEVGELSERE